jgi:hypothetical protein
VKRRSNLNPIGDHPESNERSLGFARDDALHRIDKSIKISYAYIYIFSREISIFQSAGPPLRFLEVVSKLLLTISFCQL